MMPSENGGQSSIANVSILVNNSNPTSSASSISQFAQQQLQATPLGRPNQPNNQNKQPSSLSHQLVVHQLQPNNTSHQFPRTHAASPALRPNPAEAGVDPDVLQTMSEPAPSGSRSFNHLLLSRPIKSEPNDEDDITIVGQSMAHPHPVRFLQPPIPQQVLTGSNATHILRQPVVQQSMFHQSAPGHPITQPPPAHRMTNIPQQPQPTQQLPSAVHIRPQGPAPRAIAPGPPNSSVIRIVRAPTAGSTAVPGVMRPSNISTHPTSRPNHPIMPQNPQAIQQMQQHQQVMPPGVIPQSTHSQLTMRSGPVTQVSASGGRSGNVQPGVVTTGTDNAGGSTPTVANSNTDHFPGVGSRLTSAERLIEILNSQHRHLDNRSVLNHEGLVDPHNAERVIQSIGGNNDGVINNLFQRDGGPHRCVECVDTFAMQDAYEAHRDRNAVDINYECDHCERVRTFGNKCALFSHVRGHRKGSIDPTRLKIRVYTQKRTSNSGSSIQDIKSKLEKYVTETKKINNQNASYEEEYSRNLAKIEEIRTAIDNLKAATTEENSHPVERVSSEPNNTEQPQGSSSSANNHVVNGPNSDTANAGIAVGIQSKEVVEKEIEKSVAVPLGNNENTKKCIFCNQSFRNDAALRKHFVGGDVSSGRSEASEPSSNAAGVSGPNTSSANGSPSSSLQINCPLCRMMVHSGTTLCALKAHMLFHLDLGRVCPDCGFVANDSDELKAEVSMRHHLHTECLHFQQVYVNLCTFCPEEEQRAYHNASQLAGHVKQSHAVRLFACSVCDSLFENEYGWHRHLVSAHQIQASNENRRIVFQCPVCQKEIPQTESVPSRCDPVRFHIEKHCSENEHSLTEAYRCFMQCKQIFYDQGSLKDHMRACNYCSVMAPVSSEKLPCLLCLRANSNHLRAGDRGTQHTPRQIFNNLSMLRTHERSHLRWTTLANSSSATMQCPWCRTELDLSNRRKSENHLTEHAKAVLAAITADATTDDAPNPPAALLTCHCGIQINSLTDLNTHFQTAKHPVLSEEQRSNGPQPTSCSECSWKFHRFSQLVGHIYTEHRQMCYFCNSFQASSRWDLPSHLWTCLAHGPRIGSMGSHVVESMTQRSSHDCTQCSESFYSSSELHEHLRREHGIEKRSSCLLCECIFSTEEQLKQHTQTAHAQAVMGGAGLLRCWHCPKKFDKRATLERHMIHVHKVAKHDIENNRALKRDRYEDDASQDNSSKNPNLKRVRILKRDGSFTDSFECAKCVFSTKDRATFHHHIKQFHRCIDNGSCSIDSSELMQCPECGLCFQTEMPLTIHLIAAHKIPRPDCATYISENENIIKGITTDELSNETSEEENKTSVEEPMIPSDSDVMEASTDQINEAQMDTDAQDDSKDETDDNRDEDKGQAKETDKGDEATSSFTCIECKYVADSLDLLKKHERSHGMLFLKQNSNLNSKKGQNSNVSGTAATKQ